MRINIIFIVFMGCGQYDGTVQNIGIINEFTKVRWTEVQGASPTIVFMGDSRVELYPVWNYWPGRHVINIGKTDLTTFGLLGRILYIKQFNPDIVHVSIGLNDIFYHTDVDHFHERLIEIIRDIKSAAPGAAIYITNIVPVQNDNEYGITTDAKVDELNIDIPSICDSEGVTYIDLGELEDPDGGLSAAYYRDGTHYNQAGYDKLSEILHRHF